MFASSFRSCLFFRDVLFNEDNFPFAKSCSTNFQPMSPLDLTSFQVQSTTGLHTAAPISVGSKSFSSASLGSSAQAQSVFPALALLPQPETFLPYIPTPPSPLQTYSPIDVQPTSPSLTHTEPPFPPPTPAEPPLLQPTHTVPQPTHTEPPFTQPTTIDSPPLHTDHQSPSNDPQPTHPMITHSKNSIIKP